jgi:hypothetical protein
MSTNIDDDNVILYAIKAYDKPHLVKSEFEADYARFKYITRLINKYKKNDDMKERLILNHIIILGNVFGVEATVKILFLKTPPTDYSILKTFLIYLNYLPKYINTINGQSIDTTTIPLEWKLVELLRSLTKE